MAGKHRPIPPGAANLALRADILPRAALWSWSNIMVNACQNSSRSASEKPVCAAKGAEMKPSARYRP